MVPSRKPWYGQPYGGFRIPRPKAAEGLGALTRRFAEALHNIALDVELPRDLFEVIAQRYVDHTRRHMELEEQIFYPRALLRLEGEDWADIDAAITSSADPLFGNKLADEYRKLHRRILELIELDNLRL